jgi:hypothetical protein
MTKIESSVQIIHAAQESVYNKLSDLSNLQLLEPFLPKDKITDFSCDYDSVSFSAAMAGKVTIRVVEREPLKTIKFGSDQSPVSFNLWIQLLPTAPYETKARITLHADIPFYLKPMIGNKLKDGVEKMAEMLTRLPY